MADTRSTRYGCDHVTTLAMLDGSHMNVETGTMQAIEWCADIVRDRYALPEIGKRRYVADILLAETDARVLCEAIREDTPIAGLDCEPVECLQYVMYDAESAMHELGFLAYWEDSIFRIETINDESETE